MFYLTVACLAMETAVSPPWAYARKSHKVVVWCHFFFLKQQQKEVLFNELELTSLLI